MPELEVDGAFLRNAVLDSVVPQAADADLGEILNASSDDGDPESLLPTVPQRELIFFDETVTLYIVLKVANCSEATLTSHLPRLKLKLEAFAVHGQVLEGQDGAQGLNTREQIFSGGVEDQEDPFIIVNESEEDHDYSDSDVDTQTGDREDGKACLVVWKVKAFINRPRVRLNQPAIMFVPSANLQPTDDQIPREVEVKDEYLPSLIPASVNLLAPLREDPAFAKTEPFLPASRLSRVIPVTRTEQPMYRIRNVISRPYRVVPAVSARVRYSRMNTYSSRPTTIASLDFEVTPYVSSSVTLNNISLGLSDGQVVPLMDKVGLTMPLTCNPRDDTTFLYKLIPNINPEIDPHNNSTVLPGSLDVSISATVALSPHCQPKISMNWRTNVDFSTPLNPTYGGPSQFLQRNNRPASLLPMPVARLGTATPTNYINNNTNNNNNHNLHNGGTSTPNRQSLLRDRALSFATEMGITVSFSGASVVEVGRPFFWNTFIVNHSTKTKKLAIVAIPHRRRTDMKGHVSRPSNGSGRGGFIGNGGGGNVQEDDVAEAVVDENIVHAIHRSALTNDANLICISADVRVGPLLPGSCHAVELKFLPLVAGPLLLDAVRLIDVTTNEVMDVRDLPDIVAVDGLID